MREIDLSEYTALGRRSWALEAEYAYWIVVGITAVICSAPSFCRDCPSKPWSFIAVGSALFVGAILILSGVLLLIDLRKTPETPLLWSGDRICFYSDGRWRAIAIRSIRDIGIRRCDRHRSDGTLIIRTDGRCYRIAHLRSLPTVRSRLERLIGAQGVDEK